MSVIAVVVTYRPDLPGLARALAALAPQVAGIALVDNGSGLKAQEAIKTCLVEANVPHQTLFLPENLGLAKAQNAGTAMARDMEADAVLLMDQDSHPAPDMVAELLEGLVSRRDSRPAAIGPGYEEPHRGADAGLRGAEEVPEMPALIASGCLIPLKVMDAIGPFDERLFIDFVDTEWCFRARAAGYRCFAARKARMIHRIGDTTLRFAGRNRAVHSPVRMYYQIRNLLLLARRPSTPRAWFWRTLPLYITRSLVLGVAVAPRMQRIRAVVRGIWHGLVGKSGPALLP